MDLKKAMKDVGLSNESMAHLTGIPASRVAAYKSGARRMGRKTAAKMADYVDADSAELVTENRLAAMKRAADKGDARGVLNAVKSIVGVSEKSSGGASDEDLDELVTWAVKFAENHAGAASGWGMGDDEPDHDGDGRNARGYRMVPFEDLDEGEDDIDDEGRDARGIRRRPAKEAR